MIKVLIAEDEKPIARNVCKVIESINPAFKVVESVYNGKKAIEFIESNDIDVIFLDINMPIMDGIAVAKYINEHNIDIIIVFLTGYKDFNYAQEAIRNNVFEYLLKPIEKEKMANVLHRIEVIIKRKKREAYMPFYHEFSHTIFETGDILTERCFVGSIFIGTQTTSALDSEIEEEITKVEIELIDILDDLIGKDGYWLTKAKEISEHILFINYNVKAYRNKMMEFESKIKGFNIPVSIVLTPDYIEIENISLMYPELKKININQMRLNTSTLCFYDALKESHNTQFEESTMVKITAQITESITLKSVEELLEQIISLSLERKRLEHNIKYFFYSLCENLASKSDYLDLEEEIVYALQSAYNKDELKQKCMSFVTEYYFLDVKKQGNKGILVLEMIDYLKINYQKAFSNKVLEEVFGYSQVYLRKVFKEEVGSSPNDYLMQIRIDKAKELLLCRLQVNEVAGKVGFNDPLYFSKVFKKKVGCNPSGYETSIYRSAL